MDLSLFRSRRCDNDAPTTATQLCIQEVAITGSLARHFDNASSLARHLVEEIRRARDSGMAT